MVRQGCPHLKAQLSLENLPGSSLSESLESVLAGSARGLYSLPGEPFHRVLEWVHAMAAGRWWERERVRKSKREREAEDQPEAETT